MQDIVIAGFVIPAVVSAVVSGLWTYFKDRNLKRLEGDLQRQLEAFRSSLQAEQEALKSRLQREQEAFRLAQSPRVTGAVKLWAAFCEFDRRLRPLLSPGRIVYIPDDTKEEDKERVRNEQWQKQEAEFQTNVAQAWDTLKVARDEAEVLLPGETFDLFHEVFSHCLSAYDMYRVEQMTRAVRTGGALKSGTTPEVLEQLNAADAKRLAVVKVIRRLIAEPLV